MATALTGCQVNTRVAVDEAGPGRGVVSVTVTLDAAALAAIGGRAALAAQLQDADLIDAGWTVAGPQAGQGSTTVISARHPFATVEQAGVLVGDLAGAGPDRSRPFRLSLSEHHSFWRTDTVLAGTVDLTCGLACFGDSELTAALGSPVGVNPAPLAATAGESPQEALTFSLTARLVGSLVSTDAAARDQDGTLQWTPRLGHTVVLAAVTRSWNASRIKAFAIAGGVLVLALLVLIGLSLRRWRRRRRRDREATGRGKAGSHARGGARGKTVAPRS